jgi:hypothetical protein
MTVLSPSLLTSAGAARVSLGATRPMAKEREEKRKHQVSYFDETSVLSPKYEVFCCDQNGPPARREEGAYLNRYVTDEQRSRRPIFIATLRAARLLTGCFVAHRSKTTAGILPLRFAHPAKIRSSATTPVTDLVH